MKKYFCLIALISLFSINIHAETYYKFNYLIQKGDTPVSILRFFLKRGAKLKRKDPMVRKIIKANTHVKSWRNLEPGVKIQLFIKKKIAHTKIIKDYGLWLEEKDKKIVRDHSIVGTDSSQNGGNFYYVYSSYSFMLRRENTISLADLNYPVGIGGSIYFFKGTHLGGKLYMFNVEYIKSTKISTYLIPDQFMANASFGKLFMWNKITPIASLEYQTNFNLDRVGSEYQIRENKFLWLEFTSRVDFNIDSKKVSKVLIYPSIGYSLISNSAISSGLNSISVKGFRVKFYAKLILDNFFFVKGGMTKVNLTGNATLEYTKYDGSIGFHF